MSASHRVTKHLKVSTCKQKRFTFAHTSGGSSSWEVGAVATKPVARHQVGEEEDTHFLARM